MGNGGLAKHSGTNLFSRGCKTECPSVMPYVHVISQRMHGATQQVCCQNRLEKYCFSIAFISFSLQCTFL